MSVETEGGGAPDARSRERTLVLLLLLAFAVFMGNGVWAAVVRSDITQPDPAIGVPSYDYYVYYVAGRSWTIGVSPYTNHPGVAGSLPFPVGSDGRPDRYLYPPTLLPAIGLLSWFNYSTARLTWIIINVAAYIVVVVLAAFLRRRRWLEIVTAAVLLTMASFAFLYSIHQGQIDLLVSSLAIAGFLLYGRRGNWYTALLLALSIVAKLSPAVVLIAIVAYYRDPRVLLKTALVCAVLVGLSLPLVGVGVYREYISAMMPVVSTPDATMDNLSMLRHLASFPSMARVITLLGYTSLAVVAYLAGRRTPRPDATPEREREQDALLLLTVAALLLFSPLLWSMTTVWLLVPLALVLTAPPPRWNWAPVAILAGAVIASTAPGVGYFQLSPPLAASLAPLGLAILCVGCIAWYLPFMGAARPKATTQRDGAEG